MKLVVTGHGNYASGIESTIKLLAGGLKNVSFIDFTSDMDEDGLYKKFSQEIKDDDAVVFICDLLGGTPFKDAVKLSVASDKDISVTCGCNVGSIMEVGLQLSNYKDSSKKLADEIVSISKNGTKVFEHKKVEQEPDSDGI
ncbi:PTS sugar transporter subunit IIA [Companilactobacillus halodurans]|uniref:PTS sugar transporter subunit IIA n=1 Tax=Companilactobacillus halodurans TaxID=2584183 RepID=A0A5P0ZM89_9LACO|nr:PTS sugar transporter subunit IIA [Companilactobacillus halodurans]MQS75292.1 PTS sugar transporter subunit IIA [Companilactobacillus halodurans]MQS98140.1 PTS sugar transporter subunit IIA [Companilactobacillus halodurans]